MSPTCPAGSNTRCRNWLAGNNRLSSARSRRSRAEKTQNVEALQKRSWILPSAEATLARWSGGTWRRFSTKAGFPRFKWTTGLAQSCRPKRLRYHKPPHRLAQGRHERFRRQTKTGGAGPLSGPDLRRGVCRPDPPTLRRVWAGDQTSEAEDRIAAARQRTRKPFTALPHEELLHLLVASTGTS